MSARNHSIQREECDIIDYYSILNVSKEANEEEIKAAYKRLVLIYHPDKQSSKENSNPSVFQKITQAYNCLKCPKLRKIYDEFGVKGIEAASQVGEYTDGDAARLRAWLKYECEQTGKWQAKSHIVPSIDASMLIDNLGDVAWMDYWPFLRSLSITEQVSGTLPYTENSQCSIYGSTAASFGGGSQAIFGASLSHMFTCTLMGKADVCFGSQKKLALSLSRPIPEISSTLHFGGEVGLEGGSLWPLVNCGISRSFEVVSLSSNLKIDSYFEPELELSCASSMLVCNLRIPWYDLAPTACAIFQKEVDSQRAVRLKIDPVNDTAFNPQLSIGLIMNDEDGFGEEEFTQFTDSPNAGHNFPINVFLECGSEYGIAIRLQFSPFPSIKMEIPIHFSSHLSVSSLLMSTAIPTLAHLLYQNVIKGPLKNWIKDKEAKEREEEISSILQAQKEEALLVLHLLAHRPQKHGSNLIITKATYHTAQSEDTLDVTDALNSLIYEDSLILAAGRSKTLLIGFYNISFGKPKFLSIEYVFGENQVHSVCVGDRDALMIPQRSHLIKR